MSSLTSDSKTFLKRCKEPTEPKMTQALTHVVNRIQNIFRWYQKKIEPLH